MAEIDLPSLFTDQMSRLTYRMRDTGDKAFKSYNQWEHVNAVIGHYTMDQVGGEKIAVNVHCWLKRTVKL